MNRAIKEATVSRYHCDARNQLRQHLADFVTAYNFDRRLKSQEASRLTKSPAAFGPQSQPLHLKSYASKPGTNCLV